MNTLKILFIFALIAFLQCKQNKPDGQRNESLMEMDKNPAESKNVSLHSAKDTIRLEESMLNLGENPNVTQMDLDVVNGKQSSQVQLVKPGEKLILDEKRAGK